MTATPEFDRTELSDAEKAERVLGTETFSGRVYSPEKARDVMNVNVLTGEETHDIPSADVIAQWAATKNREDRETVRERRDARIEQSDKPRADVEADLDDSPYYSHTDKVVLVAASGEQLYETQSLVSRAAFFHMDVTDHEKHFCYLAACRHPDYTVDWEADYHEGTVTITVERDGDH